MSEAITQAAREAVKGVREGLEAGKEVEHLISDIVKFADSEAVARARFRKKAQVVSADHTTFTAVAEWRKLKEVKDLEDELRIEIVSKHGKAAWDEILKIKDRHLKEQSDNKNAFGEDIRKLRLLMVGCCAAAALVTLLLYKAGLI